MEKQQKFSLNALLEGIQQRDLRKEDAKLVEKWTQTGLLRGLKDSFRRKTMARLLENQAAQVLREANALSTGGGAVTTSGQVRGFSNVAFPIVRRVFGGLVANELVSVQAMSLPSGLLFYLDYTYGSGVGMEGPSLNSSATTNTYKAKDSIYGNPPGKGIQSGSLAAGGQYDLAGSGFTRVHTGSYDVDNDLAGTKSGVFGAWTSGSNTWAQVGTDKYGIVRSTSDLTGTNGRELMYDPDVVKELADGTAMFTFCHIATDEITSTLSGTDMNYVDQIALTRINVDGGAAAATNVHDFTAWPASYQGGVGVLNLRRLNKRGDWSTTNYTWTDNPIGGAHIQMVLRLTASTTPLNWIPAWGRAGMSAVVADALSVDSTDGSTLTVPSFESNFSTSAASAAIPEIDIKIESIAVTTETRKLRARWSPELAQDLNAYHSMDAEVELTQILSEQIAVDIDREILGDLLRQANGANYYWSRMPGKMVNKTTGIVENRTSTLSPGPAFTGTVREWYETLVETIIDVANTIHRKTLRGSANFIVTGPDVCTIFEATMMYKPNMSFDGMGQASTPFQLGAMPIGSLSNRFTVYKDPYFPRNRILVGYKGGSYLETGYVYAPYVPLIVTPTIFAPEDFTPRKACMTRYGKKMVRSDFFGTVTVMDMDVI